VSFEVQGGGFSWFGQPPANKVLTAYGLMEFSDMAKVYEIDERVIDRTAKWLIGQQTQDGSWRPDANYLPRRELGQYPAQRDPAHRLHYMGAGFSAAARTPRWAKAVSYLKENWRKADNAYTLAIIANAFAAADKKDPAALDVIEKLMDMKKEEGDTVYWEAGIKSFCFSEGKVANLENHRHGRDRADGIRQFPDVVKKALNYIVRGKDPNGTWYSTQATVNCLKALVKSLAREARHSRAGDRYGQRQAGRIVQDHQRRLRCAAAGGCQNSSEAGCEQDRDSFRRQGDACLFDLQRLLSALAEGESRTRSADQHQSGL